jgi:hypothetical protein
MWQVSTRAIRRTTAVILPRGGYHTRLATIRPDITPRATIRPATIRRGSPVALKSGIRRATGST